MGYYNKFDFYELLGGILLICQRPQCWCVEHGLEYITFYVQKHIAQLAACSGPPACSRQAARGACICENRLFKDIVNHKQKWKVSKMHIMWYMGSKFHTIFWTNTSQNLHFTGCKKWRIMLFWSYDILSHGEMGPVSIYMKYIPPKHILWKLICSWHSFQLPNHFQIFWQSTAVWLPCSVKNSKWLGN